ncbi:hypothetical protein [Rubritalea tangerina]|uniref:hypothetical protein n=1 Tax=Rubritalea tangerina TaxID=430798 RepID=UPI003613DDE5
MRYLSLITLAALQATAMAQNTFPSLQVHHSQKLEVKDGSELAKLISEDALSDAQLDAQRTDGRWLGPNWWANRLHDWSVNEGAVTCEPNRPFLGWRVAHDMTRVLGDDFEVVVDLGMKASGTGELSDECVAGFLVGAGHSQENRLSKMMVFDFKAPKKGGWPATEGAGIAIGVNGSGVLRIIDLDSGKELGSGKISGGGKQVKLKLRGKRKGDDVTLSATAESGNGQSEVSATVPASRLVGGVGLLSHPGKKKVRQHHW